MLLLGVLAGIGCAGASPEREAAGRYARPDLDRLLSGTDPCGAGSAGAASDAIRETQDRAAVRAVWAAVAAAESAGLVELYGQETFGLGEASYRALFFVRTSDGRCRALFADADFHDAFRAGVDTVPCLPVPPATMELLRARIAPEIPPQTRPFEQGISDEMVTLLHLFVNGRSYAAALPTSTSRVSTDREDLERFQSDYGSHSIVDALWAAAPLAFFPTRDSGPDETYGTVPGFAPAGK
jgi:hypothetical protein